MYKRQELIDYVCCCKDVMYTAYLRDRTLLAKNQLAEVKFSDLTSNPVGTVESIYNDLEIDGQEPVLSAVQDNFKARKNHKKNVHKVDSWVSRINDEWADYMEVFGYEPRNHSGEQSNVA